MTREVKPSRLRWWALGGLAVVIVLWGTNLIVFMSMGTQDRGTFGDMFGVVNSLFSGLAFLGVIIAIFLQREEIQLQRRDLVLQRRELELTREEMRTQTESFRRRNFEATFFQLLRLHNEIVESLTLLPEGQSISGRFCFHGWWNYAHENRKPEERSLENALDYFRTKIQPIAGHYYRNLYNIVLFVGDQAEPEHKTLYMRLVRAQLSRHEALLLACNCLSEFGREKFKPLVEQYALLKGVGDLMPSDHKADFAASAFGEDSASERG